MKAIILQGLVPSKLLTRQSSIEYKGRGEVVNDTIAYKVCDIQELFLIYYFTYYVKLVL